MAKEITFTKKLEIQARDKYICQYCGKDGLDSFDSWDSMTVDHFNGDHEDNSNSNLKTACHFCNSRKATDGSANIEKIRSKMIEKKIEELEKFYNIKKEIRE